MEPDRFPFVVEVPISLPFSAPLRLCGFNSRQIDGMTLPPQTGMYAPVMKLARSEARNATTLAIS